METTSSKTAAVIPPCKSTICHPYRHAIAYRCLDDSHGNKMNINKSPIITKNPHTKLSNSILSLLRQEFTIESNYKVTPYGRHNKSKLRKTKTKSMKYFPCSFEYTWLCKFHKKGPTSKTYFISITVQNNRCDISAGCKYVSDSMRKLAPNINWAILSLHLFKKTKQTARQLIARSICPKINVE